MLRRQLEQQWYNRPHWLLLFAPLSWLYAWLSRWRRQRLTAAQTPSPLPVIVVGNIAVGGTGKTPVIIALVACLRELGFRPGVIARGYGGKVVGNRLLSLDADPDPKDVGDEPLLIAQLSGCPVVVGSDRLASIQLLMAQTDCNLVLSDDGLQHYLMARDLEIAVIDGQRGFGNGWLLPVGPLREPPARLTTVDWVLLNGEGQRHLALPTHKVWPVRLVPVGWKNVKTGELLPLTALSLTGAQAIAGIGNPERFFQQLRCLGFDGITRSFADHHLYIERDLDFCDYRPLLMTEKDAVKCRAFARESWWALQVKMMLPEGLVAQLGERLQHIIAAKSPSP